MADSSMFDISDGSDFEAATKPKAKPAKATVKAAPKKTAAAKAKPATKSKPVVPKKRVVDEDEEPESDLENNFQDESLLDDTPPKAKKQKVTANPVKSPHKKPLAELVNENIAADPDSPMPAPGKKKRVSEQYQKLTQLEHIIRRPDTYIGSTEKTEKQVWVFNSETKTMEFRDISYVPGLFKIFDEILVNAADNKQNDSSMKEIRVTIDSETGTISVQNDGKGIPIEIHSKEKVYIPELIFGHLLAGSNFDDNQQKVTGGRNGYGAKLCNVFSTEFTVETNDKSHKKKYKQTWTDNMSKMGKAKITDSTKNDYTKVTFKPDFKKFNLEGLDDDHVALFKRRVYDMCGTLDGVTVYLNDEKLPIRTFKKYIELYTKAIKKERGAEAVNDTSEIIIEKPNERWEIGFTVSDGSFQQISFVNSISTTVGGSHVNYVADQITNKLAEIVKKKNKGGANLKPNQIRNHIFVFVNCLIVNPAFSSQTKEQLTTKPSQFGSKCEISDDFMKKIAKTEVIANILSFAQQKADQILKKSDGSRRSRMHDPKLTDANKAGTKDGHLCTLILTEGDSAKGMAMAGRSVVGADYFGVFPLRGKLLNVRDASIDQISKNKEIQNIKNFLGLQHKKVYTDAKGLRYGHLMIMTDQDHDGSHIKGLLINFLQVQFPSLLKLEGFLIEFITPIVKVFKGTSKDPIRSKAFYTMPEYIAWKELHRGDRTWKHKYYKGLGTSSTEEQISYFNDLDRHHKEFETMKDDETELIELAFSKKKADDRKEWLRQFKPGTFFDYSVRKITYTDFINKELILFSMADNIRSIPSVIDGFKPTQRKVMYTCFKRNIKTDMKVIELAGLVMGLTAYQHGDASLAQTIVGLAQSFVGSNNINCLEPAGQFGTRLQGGQDAASARYIYTHLSAFARKLFHVADEPLLKYNTDDDREIEPEIYAPILPMVLVNGADGIGTGWSSSIPNYNPVEIVDNLKRKMEGGEFQPMRPWFRGFKGPVTDAGPDRFKFSGIVKQSGDNEIEITELPIRVWTQDYKEKLEEIIKAEKIPSFIKDYRDYNTHEDVNFIIQMDDKNMKSAVEEGLEERFKLSKTIATSNLVAFDPEGRIMKYASIDAIMEEFYAFRLHLYQRRKDHLLKEMDRDLKRLTNQARFVQMIIDGKLNISRKKKAVLIAELKKLDFLSIPKTQDASKVGELEAIVNDNDEETGEDEHVPDSSSYDYLLGMSLWSLTQERVEKLNKQIGDKQTEIDVLLRKSKEDLWRADLDDFVAEWEFQLEDEKERGRKARSNRRTSKKFTVSKAGKKRKGNDNDSDDDYEKTSKPKKSVAAAKPKPKQGTLPFGPKPYVPAPGPSMSPFFQRELAKNFHVRTQTDGASDDIESQTSSAAASQSKPSQSGKLKNESDSDVAPSKPAVKASRAATTKKPKYALSSDDEDSNGDDLLAGLGQMVKSLPGTLDAAPKPRPAKPAAKPSKIDELSDVDMQDDSQQTDAKKTLDVFDISEDDSDAKPKKKVPAKKAAAVKGKATTGKIAPKKEQQSPAAKAYAQRLQKKKPVVLSDEDDIANDILDSPDESEPESVQPAARPGRRAAAAKPKVTTYKFDDSDEDEDDFADHDDDANESDDFEEDDD